MFAQDITFLSNIQQIFPLQHPKFFLESERFFPNNGLCYVKYYEIWSTPCRQPYSIYLTYLPDS